MLREMQHEAKSNAVLIFISRHAIKWYCIFHTVSLGSALINIWYFLSDSVAKLTADHGA